MTLIFQTNIRSYQQQLSYSQARSVEKHVFWAKLRNHTKYSYEPCVCYEDLMKRIVRISNIKLLQDLFTVAKIEKN